MIATFGYAPDEASPSGERPRSMNRGTMHRRCLIAGLGCLLLSAAVLGPAEGPPPRRVEQTWVSLGDSRLVYRVHS